MSAIATHGFVPCTHPGQHGYGAVPVICDRCRLPEGDRAHRLVSIEATCAACGDQCVVPGDEDPADTLCVACAEDEQGF